MSLMAQNFHRMIQEQKEREKRRKKKRNTQIIKVWKYDPDIGRERLVEVETSDSGTLREMFEKYGNEFRFFCAQYPVGEYELFPDRGRAKIEVRKNKKLYDVWNRRNEEDLLTSNNQLNPLRFYSEHTAWIDLDNDVILVERAQ